MDELSTREAAERLGVKPETVYAYVSRGLLSSRRAPGGRGSRFDAREVDALARRHRRPHAAAEDGDTPAGTPVRTGITLIERDRYFFRGVDATALAAAYGYEEVADWLWTGRLTPGVRFTAPPEPRAAATAAAAALAGHAGPVDRL
ncbi:citrate synthase, partial [Streptomyces synnematoformans]|uniref:citrate synthase n=1 Tax=Streptomyces synnematoformans TaxID=415721 RepID=UPI0031CFD0D9